MKGMRCKLVSFIDATGYPIKHPASFKGPLYALIIRLEKHPKLGPPRPGKHTITSKVRHINFPAGYFITQNSTYDFAGG